MYSIPGWLSNHFCSIVILERFDSDYEKIWLQALMLIVPDVQDVYTPLETDVVVQLSEVSSRSYRL